MLWLTSVNWASGCAEVSKKEQEKPKDDPVNNVLESLNRTTLSLQSYQSQIEYKYSQPLLESETLDKGMFYYTRSDGQSALSINFNTRKQDDEKEQKYAEQYIILDGGRLPLDDREFKGIWLAHLDYQVALNAGQ